jgi:predicted dithiol-disulfide oxidoreductase (DUF899 family)
MNLPEVVSHEEWLAARKELLDQEKEVTRIRDALNTQRRRLPMERVTKDYTFEGPDGEVHLLDLFEGRLQLIVEHVMFDPSWDDACPSCSGRIDNVGRLEHLHARNTTLAAVSRAPFAKLERFRARMEWKLPWYSSHGGDFSYDFHVSFDEGVTPIEYNYRTKDELVAAGAPVDEWDQPFELHGQSVFLRDGDDVFHTYDAYARGTEQVGGAHYYLDMTALGRQEDWEEPASRAIGAPSAGQAGVRYHDEYDDDR